MKSINISGKVKYLLLVVLIGGLVISTAGCGGNSSTQKKEMGVAFQPHYFAAVSGILANSKKIDKLDNGTNITYGSYLSGSDMISSMIAKDQSIGYMGDMPGLVAADKDQLNGVIIAKDVWSPGATTAIVTRQGEFDSVKDLDQSGTKIKVNHYSYSHRFLLHVMDQEGFKNIKESDLLDGSPTTMLTQLENGDIDAAVVWEPFVSEIMERSKKSEKFEAEILATGKDYSEFQDLSVVVAHPDLVENQPETVVEWLKVHLKMEQIVKNKPKQAKKLLSEPNTSYSEWIAKRSLDTFGKVNAMVTKEDKKVLKEGANFLQKKGIISEDFNLEKHINMSLLKKAKKELQ